MDAHIIVDDMGSFRVDVELENPALPGVTRMVESALVDTGAELSCFPARVLDALGIVRRGERRFRQTDGSVFVRSTGTAIVHVGDASAGDEIVFGEGNDLTLLGSRSLEGLNLRIDPISKRLSDAGPMLMAASKP